MEQDTVPANTRLRKREPTINGTYIAYAWEVNGEDKMNNMKRLKKEFTFDVPLDESRDEGTEVANPIGKKRNDPANVQKEDDINH